MYVLQPFTKTCKTDRFGVNLYFTVVHTR